MARIPYLQFCARLHVPINAVTFAQKLHIFIYFFFVKEVLKTSLKREKKKLPVTLNGGRERAGAL